MRPAGAFAAILLFVLAAPAAAVAQLQDHDSQPGLRAGIGTGVAYALDYGSNTGISGRAPFAVTACATWGLSSALELELGGVFALEQGNPIAVAAGVRYFYNPLAFLKFYSTLDALIPVRPDPDFGLRNEDGIQYDVNSHVGLFFGLDLSILFVREFSAGAGVLAGVQGRY